MPPEELNENATTLEAAIDNVGGPPADGGDNPALNTADTSVVDAPAGDAPVDDKPAEQEPAKPGAKAAAFLDSIGEQPATVKPAAKPVEKAADKPAAPAADAAPKPADQEEAELLEGVKSDRGKERIKQVFAEKKQLETDINEFRELINSTGMKPQEFAHTLEFGRLVNSGNEQDLKVAIEMLDGQRAALYAKLGVEAPGVDLLAGHDDLKSSVENMEITRERAVELAKFRKNDGEKKARETASREADQSRQEFEQTVNAAAGQMEAYLDTRKNEVDHTARMRVVSDHFRKPENLQNFVQTYRPEQWGATIKMMYDNIQVPRTPQPQPLRSRPTNLGAPAASGVTAIDRIAQRMDSMGL